MEAIFELRVQATLISAYLASLLIVIVVMFHYVFIFPYTTTLSVKTKYYDIKSIIYSKPTWTAKQLANSLLNIFNAKYICVNITVVNITNSNVIYTDSYIISSINNNLNREYEFRVSRLDASGLYYIYVIRVGY